MKIRIPYLFRFTAWDLFEWTSLRTTVAVVVTVAAAAGFATLARGLALGAYQVSVQRLRDDPLNRSLWYGVGSARMMTRERVGQLATILKEKFPAGTVEGISPFSRTNDDWEWRKADAKSIGHPVGRTIKPDDRLLESFPLRGRPSLKTITEKDRGIVASPRMLEQLGYDLDPKSLPITLSLRIGLREPVEVPVLGVTQKELPLFDHFVIGEQYEAELRQLDSDPILESGLVSGPVPEKWADAVDQNQLPDEVRKALELEDGELLILAVDPLIDGPHWHLTYLGNRQRKSEKTYRTWLAKIAGKMSLALNQELPDAVLKIPDSQLPNVKAVPLADHQYAGVVVTDVERLPEVEKMVNQALLLWIPRKELAVPLNQGVSEEIIKLSSQTGQILRILTALSLGIAGVALLNLLVIEWLRAERKLPEWGMLKAVGMTEGELATLGLLEGTTLGGGGVLLGTIVGILAGQFISASYYRDQQVDPRLGFLWSPMQVALTLLTVAALAGIGTWLANYRARSQPPSESLKMR